MPDSSVAGFLVPAGAPAPVPLEGAALEDFISVLLVGLTGFDQSLVRPAWQPEPPDMPAAGTNWVAHAIIDSDPDVNAVEMHEVAGNGDNLLIRHEVITWRVSCFGPGAWATAGAIRDGLQIAQNREALVASGFGLVECGRAVPAPVLVKDRFRYRVDLSLAMRREIQRQFSVLSLLGEVGTLSSEVLQNQSLNRP